MLATHEGQDRSYLDEKKGEGCYMKRKELMVGWLQWKWGWGWGMNGLGGFEGMIGRTWRWVILVG